MNVNFSVKILNHDFLRWGGCSETVKISPQLRCFLVCISSEEEKNQLIQRLKEELKSGPNSCILCERRFSHKHEVMHHIRNTCLSVELQCSQCSKTFHNRQTLWHHKTTEHEQKFQFVCPKCGKGFYCRHHFNGHVNSHLSIKPFQCEHCSKGFKYEFSLKRHKQNAHV